MALYRSSLQARWANTDHDVMRTQSAPILTSRKGQRINFAELVPSAETLHEIDAIAVPLIQSLHHIVVLLTKETRGVRPAFGLDFEVLHAYLFPTIQRRSSSVPPSLATYIIDESKIRLVLPPGAVIELLHFAKNCFPMVSRFRDLTSATPTYRMSSVEIDELVSMYGQLVEPDADQSALTMKTDSIIYVLSEFFADITTGFERLNRLLAEGRFQAFDELVTDWPEVNEGALALMSDLAARIAAGSQKSYRPRGSNVEDARNIAVLLLIDRQQTRQFQNARQKTPDSAIRDQPEGVAVQLVTATKPLLNLNLEQYGGDVIARDLGVKPSHMTQTGHSWIICPLSTAAVYCSLRNAYETVEECLESVYRLLGELTRIEATIYDFEALHQSIARRTSIAHRNEWVERLFAEGTAGWYINLRDTLSKSRVQLKSHRSLYPETFSMQTELSDDFLANSEAHQGNFLASFIPAPTLSTKRIKRILGITPVAKQLPGGGNIIRHGLICRFNENEDELVRVDHCMEDGFLSVRFPIVLDTEAVIDVLNFILNNLRNCEGNVVAEYEHGPTCLDSNAYNDNEYGTAALKERRVVCKLGADAKLAMAKLVLLTGQANIERALLTPRSISIESAVGDLHVMLPLVAVSSPQMVVCNCDTTIGLQSLLWPFLERGHPWKLMPIILDEVRAMITKALRCLPKQQEKRHVV